jgi:hypothetical protein
MTARRTKEAPLAPRLSLRWRISLAAVVLIALVFGVPSASASPLGKVADTVGSVVPSVTETSTPSLPSATPPQIPAPSVPEAPVDVPTVPQAPAETSPAPQAPTVKAPATRSPPNPVPVPSGGSTRPSDSGVDLPAVGEMANGKESAGTATGASAVGAQHPAASARNGVGNGSGSQGAATRPATEADHVESAQVAPLRRLLAYVWPAVALGPAWKLLATLQMRWGVATLLGISDISDLPRLLSGLTRASGTGGVAGVSEHSASSNPSPADSIDTWVLDSSEISILVFLIACAVLVALLIFTARRELSSSMSRWPF